MLRVFLAASRLGSFTAAAKALKVGQATVSRQIAALECTLGHALFDRGPDGLSLTAAGEAAMPRAETMEHAAHDLQAALQGLEATPKGVVRLAVAPSLAVDLVVPFAKLLYPRYPEIRLELVSAMDIADLTRGEADLALRIPRPTEASVVGRVVGSFELGLWASGAYVDRLPANPTLRDLDWIGWVGDYAHLPIMQWIAQQVGAIEPRFASNSFPAQRQAALAGVGVVVMPLIQAAVTPALVRVPVPTPQLPSGSLHLVMHHALRNVPRVRVVADFLVEVLTMPVSTFAALFRADEPTGLAPNATSVATDGRSA